MQRASCTLSSKNCGKSTTRRLSDLEPETGSVNEKCRSAGQSSRRDKTSRDESKITQGNKNQHNIFHLSDGGGADNPVGGTISQQHHLEARAKCVPEPHRRMHASPPRRRRFCSVQTTAGWGRGGTLALIYRFFGSYHFCLATCAFAYLLLICSTHWNTSSVRSGPRLPCS